MTPSDIESIAIDVKARRNYYDCANGEDQLATRERDAAHLAVAKVLNEL